MMLPMMIALSFKVWLELSFCKKLCGFFLFRKLLRQRKTNLLCFRMMVSSKKLS